MTLNATKGLLSTIAIIAATSSAGANQADPTCSDVLAIEVHGQHIIGDYVTGIGHGELDWPPSGSEIGEAVSANGGVAVRGGPGPGFHFPNGFAPGASFCTDSRSPGWPHDL